MVIKMTYGYSPDEMFNCTCDDVVARYVCVSKSLECNQLDYSTSVTLLQSRQR